MNTQPPDAKLSMEKDQLIKSILALEMPTQCTLEALEASIRTAVAAAPREPMPQTAAIRARRTELQALHEDDLRQLLARTTADKARQEEAKRFYNQRAAMADYAYWLGMDFWSLGDAVALLAGRDPRVVNRTTIEADIAPKRANPAGAGNPPTTFTKLFLDLSHLAERSHAMTHSPKLTPAEAIQWGKEVLGAKAPAPLLAYLEARPAALMTEEAHQEPPTAVPARPAADEPRGTEVKRVVLLSMSERWPTVASDIQHAKENGLSAAAKAPGRSMWFKEAALDWAEKRGKLRPEKSSLANNSSVFRMR